jgi:hypothetical protein
VGMKNLRSGFVFLFFVSFSLTSLCPPGKNPVKLSSFSSVLSGKKLCIGGGILGLVAICGSGYGLYHYFRKEKDDANINNEKLVDSNISSSQSESETDQEKNNYKEEILISEKQEKSHSIFTEKSQQQQLEKKQKHKKLKNHRNEIIKKLEELSNTFNKGYKDAIYVEVDRKRKCKRKLGGLTQKMKLIEDQNKKDKLLLKKNKQYYKEKIALLQQKLTKGQILFDNQLSEDEDGKKIILD